MAWGKELEPSGALSIDKSYLFCFHKFEKQFETYSGSAIRLR